jgi:hypothetical protein
VVDGQDTTLTDERSRTSIASGFDQVPAVGVAAATAPSVPTHALKSARVTPRSPSGFPGVNVI